MSNTMAIVLISLMGLVTFIICFFRYIRYLERLAWYEKYEIKIDEIAKQINERLKMILAEQEGNHEKV